MRCSRRASTTSASRPSRTSPALLALRRNASAAKSIAAAAHAFAQRHLQFDSAVAYTADVLAAYAERWKAGGGGGGGAPAAPYRLCAPPPTRATSRAPRRRGAGRAVRPSSCLRRLGLREGGLRELAR